MDTFYLGDVVRIKTGTFQSFTGRVDGINQSRRLLKVNITLLGQMHPLKLQFSEVEKVKLTKDMSDRDGQ